jgi:ATP-dependent DNA helicase PIF1
MQTPRTIEHSVEITPEFQDFFNQIEGSSEHFFITGNAGTGKSTLISYIRQRSKKNVVVLAPTGLAAINVRGQTIHSFFNFPPSLLTPDTVRRIRTRNPGLFKKIDLLIIDEASMVRADLLDAIDVFLRRVGRSARVPFGGVQVVLVGDLFQLPPVVTSGERPVLQQLYRTPYFFSAKSYPAANFTTLKLTHIFRQSDPEFISVLNNIRVGNISEYTMAPLLRRVAPDPTSFSTNRAVTLTTINATADRLNYQQLQQLPGRDATFAAFLEGSFPTKEGNLPVSMELTLRPGARVMFVKNGELWVNGSLGVVESISDDAERSIKVRMDETNQVVSVTRQEWDYVKFEYDQAKDTVTETTLGKLKQYPLRLAWAITIHKSQGMTFDAINIDFTRGAFAHGQTYVALSRCRTLEGISLSRPINGRDIIVDEEIVQFLRG